MYMILFTRKQKQSTTVLQNLLYIINILKFVVWTKKNAKFIQFESTDQKYSPASSVRIKNLDPISARIKAEYQRGYEVKEEYAGE